MTALEAAKKVLANPNASEGEKDLAKKVVQESEHQQPTREVKRGFENVELK